MFGLFRVRYVRELEQKIDYVRHEMVGLRKLLDKVVARIVEDDLGHKAEVSVLISRLQAVQEALRLMHLTHVELQGRMLPTRRKTTNHNLATLFNDQITINDTTLSNYNGDPV